MESDYELKADFKSWRSDNPGIFDYNDADVVGINYTTDEETYFCRAKESNHIRKYKRHNDIPKDQVLLFRARKNNKKQFELINVVRTKMKKNLNSIKNLDSKMWLVINSAKQGKFENNNKTYSLMENDIIKLGRKIYEVIKVNTPISSNPYYEENSINDINRKHGPVFDIALKKHQYCNTIIKNILNDDGSELGYNPERDCRICFGSESTEENPKLKICNCHDYVHFNCLKQFLKNSISISENKNGTVTSYYCNKFNCEVCKEPLPLKFTIKFNETTEPRTYYLVDGLELPEDTNYLILESLPYLKDKSNSKNIFVVKLTDYLITLGRSDICDIIDNDVSISRNHAIIKFNQENGDITFIDKSRFGVLILIRDNLKLITDEKVYIQIGRSFINVVQREKEEENETY